MAATRMSFSYPEEMKQKLEVLAEKDNRSLSSFIQILLKEGIARREQKEEVKTPQRKILSRK